MDSKPTQKARKEVQTVNGVLCWRLPGQRVWTPFSLREINGLLRNSVSALRLCFGELRANTEGPSDVVFLGEIETSLDLTSNVTFSPDEELPFMDGQVAPMTAYADPRKAA